MMALILWSHSWVDLIENNSSDFFEQIGSSWRKKNDWKSTKQLGPISNLCELPVEVSENTIAHEWYLINHKNSYIIPFVYVIFIKLSL